jgi:hypothetical protein
VARIVKLRAPRTPVAMITGWSDRIDLDSAHANGVEGVIAKPFRRDDLRRIMRLTEMVGPERPPSPPPLRARSEPGPPANAERACPRSART